MKKLDVNYCGLAHLNLILSLHYLLKCRSRSLAIYNNEFILLLEVLDEIFNACFLIKKRLENKINVKKRKNVPRIKNEKNFFTSMIKSFPSQRWDSLSRTPVCTSTGLLCLFTLQLSLALTAPTHREMVRRSWPGWLVTYPNDLHVPICRWPPIQVLTGPSIN